ncbi:MAG TPA: glycosyltransferase [Solirubrobacteraceae bacterium]|nr:glycosyltransferase [Solirubrobacteraceae bacterium]
MATPTISAVVTAYNCESFISEALASILGQSEPPLEVIVVNDGSTDRTAAAIAEHGGSIKVVEQENAGHACALNRGFAMARGDYVAKCDADDVWEPEKLAWQRRLLRSHPQVDIACGSASYFGTARGLRAPHSRSGVLESRQLMRDLFAANFICASTTLVRRTLYEALGPFDERLRAEDYDFWLRALAAGAVFAYDPRVLVRYRCHGANVSSDKLCMHQAELSVHRRHAASVQALGQDRTLLVRRTLARDLRNIGRALYDRNELGGARDAFVKSLRALPSTRALVWAALLSLPGRSWTAVADSLISIRRIARDLR